MKALRQLQYAAPLEICDVAVPQAQTGSAVVRVLVASVVSYAREVYDGTRKYPYPTPLTVGSSAIGRIHELGADATHLKQDDLVLIDIVIRSRDDPSVAFLSAIHHGFTRGSQSLMSYWRDGCCAEYIAVPLENCYKIDEKLLQPVERGGQGHALADLLYIPKYLVPYGGLADINLRPGETVIIAPATGGFGGAAVHIALALGARVIAMGRNKSSLERLQKSYDIEYPGRLTTIPMTGDVNQELATIQAAAGNCPVDAFFDISPPQAIGSSHFKAAIFSLRHSGRVSLMGGQQGDVGIPHSKVMHFNISLRGKWMYEREDVRRLIKMIEGGTVRLGMRSISDKVVPAKSFKLEEWKQAFDYAFENEGSATPAYFDIGL